MAEQQVGRFISQRYRHVLVVEVAGQKVRQTENLDVIDRGTFQGTMTSGKSKLDGSDYVTFSVGLQPGKAMRATVYGPNREQLKTLKEGDVISIIGEPFVNRNRTTGEPGATSGLRVRQLLTHDKDGSTTSLFGDVLPTGVIPGDSAPEPATEHATL